ncbi:hypothetical protein JW721_04035 [Candidatus Micrarchaeota archaeon]|nr:hypothetical protein [Candidatus Micrarchaeota archaeon]
MDEIQLPAKPPKNRKLSRAVLFFVALNISYFSPPSYREFKELAGEGEAAIEKKIEVFSRKAREWMSKGRFVEKSFPIKPSMGRNLQNPPLKLRRC